MRRHLVLLALATLACDSPARPDPEPPADVIVNAQVNVQLGNTTAGQSYQIRANVWGTGTGTDATATGTDEWVATGMGIAASGN